MIAVCAIAFTKSDYESKKAKGTACYFLNIINDKLYATGT